ncbi:MAG: DNA mismatch repair protein MutT, partial [Clostridium botulinum]|nr:DNA mismatch repair protein MutT [Clostridium botulinum]
PIDIVKMHPDWLKDALSKGGPYIR